MEDINWEEIEIKESDVKELYKSLEDKYELSSYKYVSVNFLVFLNKNLEFKWVTYTHLSRPYHTGLDYEELEGEVVGKTYVDIRDFYTVDMESRKVTKKQYEDIRRVVGEGLKKFVEDRKKGVREY